MNYTTRMKIGRFIKFSQGLKQSNEGYVPPRMDHVDTVLQGNPNNVILGKVCSYRSKTLADLIGFVRL